MENFSIRQLVATDWQLYRDLRLEALSRHPNFFSPSRDEFKFTELEWKERLDNKNAASFGLFSGPTMIGLTGIVRENNNSQSSNALLVSSYIQPEYRERGLSKLFFEARLQWAKKQGNIKTLTLEHRDDNLASQKAHQKFGFQLLESRMQSWPDGQQRPCLIYRLKI